MAFGSARHLISVSPQGGSATTTTAASYNYHRALPITYRMAKQSAGAVGVPASCATKATTRRMQKQVWVQGGHSHLRCSSYDWIQPQRLAAGTRHAGRWMVRMAWGSGPNLSQACWAPLHTNDGTEEPHRGATQRSHTSLGGMDCSTCSTV